MFEKHIQHTIETKTTERRSKKYKNLSLNNGNQDPKTIWRKCLSHIKKEILPQAYQTWFHPIEALKYENKILTLQVPSDFFCEWIEEHYLTPLGNAVKEIVGKNGKVAYSIRSHQPQKRVQTMRKTEIKRYKPTTSKLNPNYTFDRFIEGTSNQLAKSAALAIADNPGKTSFNPLFLYGTVGVGKSHLQQAIVNHTQHQYNTHYITAEEFTTQFIYAIRNKKLHDFNDYYTQLDILAIDNISFFANKEKTQEAFFRIFDHLSQNQKQIIISGNCAPRDLKGFDTRLLSHCKSGLACDIQIPTFPTRLSIIRRKLQDAQLQLSPEIEVHIAQCVTNNIREFEGIINNLKGRTILLKQKITLEIVKQLLNQILPTIQTVALDINYLHRIIAKECNLKPIELKNRSKRREVVNARHLAMYFIKKYTGLPLTSIGQHFNKDHSSVIYAIRNVNNMLETEPGFKMQYQEIERVIERSTQQPIS